MNDKTTPTLLDLLLRLDKLANQKKRNYDAGHETVIEIVDHLNKNQKILTSKPYRPAINAVGGVASAIQLLGNNNNQQRRIDSMLLQLDVVQEAMIAAAALGLLLGLEAANRKESK